MVTSAIDADTVVSDKTAVTGSSGEEVKPCCEPDFIIRRTTTNSTSTPAAMPESIMGLNRSPRANGFLFFLPEVDNLSTVRLSNVILRGNRSSLSSPESES